MIEGKELRVMKDKSKKDKKDKKKSLQEGGGSAKELEGTNELEGRRTEKRKKKHGNSMQKSSMEEDDTPDQGSGALLNDRGKKRKRGVEEILAEPDTSSQPTRKTKKTRRADSQEHREVKDIGPRSVGKAGQKKKKDKILESDESGGKLEKKHKNKTGFLDPEQDNETGLSDQARKALSYAFSQFHGPSHWKFNKARQNWLVRNLWNAQSIPEKYEDLVVKYLSAVQGNTRENLVKSCKEIHDEIKGASGEVSDENQEGSGGILVNALPPPKTNLHDRKRARARALLQALVPELYL